MTLTEQLAEAMAEIVHEATEPLLAKIAALEARPVVTFDFKAFADDLRARMLAVESRSMVPGPAGPQGPQGPQGEQGQPGARGEKGLTGDRGERGEAGPDGANGLNGKDGANGLNGKDGVGVMDAMLDRAGQLIVTLSNGQTKAVGLVVGKDGANGLDGKAGRDIDPEFVREFLTKELDKWPRPKDGADGKDGEPGVSADDFDFAFDPDTRELCIKFIRGTTVIERRKILEGMRIYRGVYEQGKSYEKGDVVTWDGSEWSAMAQTKDRPGNGSTWKLSVKHGEKGATGAPGKPGRDGKDLTQLGPDGRKW